MLIIYSNPNTISTFSGNTNTINSIFDGNMELIQQYKEIKMDDMDDILYHPYKYKVINNESIVLKETLRLSLDKNLIENNGVDTAVLTITSDKDCSSVEIIINDTLVDVNIINRIGTVAITCIEEGTFSVSPSNAHIGNTVLLEVI